MLLRILCYSALVIVSFGFLSLLFLSLTALCPRLEAGCIYCKTRLVEKVAKISYMIVLLSVYTGIPMLLALGGVGLAIYDVFFH